MLGMDVVFAEADDSSGLAQLQQLAQGRLRDEAPFRAALQALPPQLDYDQRFAQALARGQVVLGYYFTSDRDGKGRGQLPAPLFTAKQLGNAALQSTVWNGFGSNIPSLAQAAPQAGFFNAMVDDDGVVRALPVLAQYQGQYYASLALAVYQELQHQSAVRLVLGSPQGDTLPVHALEVLHADGVMRLPTDARLTAQVPYRGPGGPDGGSFTYVSAADVVQGRLAAGALRGKVALLGSTAPGLQDLRSTPVGGAYPGVEAHANLLAGMLDQHLPVEPDYAPGYNALQMLLVGGLLALALPGLGVLGASALCLGLGGALVAANWALYQGADLALPLAGVLLQLLLTWMLGMGWGFFVESRAKRHLAGLFGTYVPAPLVEEMLQSPQHYSMQASTRELTVMFCDVRNFTSLSEHMEPTALQALLNTLFTRLTQVIGQQRGTIDKYIGDCVMAFWGAPMALPAHAQHAVQAALDMLQAVAQFNTERQAQQLAPLHIGMGLNTGPMCVGDMGSDLRRSYTVLGDAVNLGARLEALCKVYGVGIVASATCQAQAPDFAWQELDRVRVSGREQALAIFTPRGRLDSAPPAQIAALAQWHQWHQWLAAFRAQDWAACDAQ